MGAKDVLSRKSGVIVGDDVLKLFNYAQEKEFAIPAIVSRIPLSSLHNNLSLAIVAVFFRMLTLV